MGRSMVQETMRQLRDARLPEGAVVQRVTRADVKPQESLAGNAFRSESMRHRWSVAEELGLFSPLYVPWTRDAR